MQLRARLHGQYGGGGQCVRGARQTNADFLVEEHASHWQVPLPQLRILELSLCYFARASTFFTSNCDHVLHTLSSLALSVFELLLFFDQKDFHEEPLKQFTVTFQECYSALARHQNVHLLQVERLVRGGGPWASSVLQAILSESSLPQSEVDRFISSELPVFFELRVRYLLSCEQRVSEAVALAKCCSLHPAAGQHSFFLQCDFLFPLFHLLLKDAIHIICSLECEEKDELLLSLCRAFLSQQLRRGDMYYLWLVNLNVSLIRLKTSKHSLLEESHQLMLSATNVNSIFPFIRAILQELGEDGIQFCVELCANALQSCLPCDVITKSLIYKTLAGLLPNDLEVCRACALLVFFHERSVEAYKMVYLLYMHPDQEYHVDSSTIRNHVRFETLQVLKKDLHFDPEFWNLIALRTNCLKLMSDKVVSAALEEIMEDKWILKYCTKDSAFRSGTSVCHKGSLQAASKNDAVETEESRLEYCCTFCNKVFKGSHVVSHAMFHYRKDECMFCGTIFKDDLLAMMHLSNHIEKLKRLKDTSNNNTRENRVSETKDHSTPRSSAKAKTTNISPGHSGTGRLRRSDICSKSISDPDSTPSGSRSLRSNDKPEDVSSRQEKKQNEGKHVKSKTPVHKINGHIGEKKKLGRPRKVIPESQAKQDVSQERTSDGAESPRLQEKRDVAVDSTTSAKEEKKISTEVKMKEKKSLQVQKTVTQQAVTEKQLKPQESLEKVCCPMDGCAWFRDLSKNRVALLYHALEDHYGEVKPLKLAFHVGNGKCSVCMRVLWSFEHFQHHIERHRLTPRYPCPHQGCPARFKTGMEMRRHARRHSPLQAACCLPGCSRLFICLWALNLHEREHYGANPTKADKDTNEQPGDKAHKPKDEPAAVTLNDTKILHKTSLNLSTATSSANKTQKSNDDKEKKVHTAKKRSNQNHSQTASSDSTKSKKHKNSNNDTKEDVSSAETPQSALLIPGYSRVTNGQEAREDAKAMQFKQTLAEYGKKPYMRAPPEAYLDERYITMPKRRKEMSPPPRNVSLEKVKVAAAVQRQRCADCFATFNSNGELQSHLQLQNCSKLFGFDSDDEGDSANSTVAVKL
uniref:Uncharacterized LOC110001337 n=1 Tax=Labrus bergylta TaxID=56723 RepID=A0A3Q3GPS2_9LABR